MPCVPITYHCILGNNLFKSIVVVKYKNEGTLYNPEKLLVHC